MIPIKIQCGCGQKYAFDLEPVDGCMGHAVACPVCGTDGTAAANVAIANHAASPVAPDLRLRIDRPGSSAQTFRQPAPVAHSQGSTKGSRKGAKTQRWLMPAIGVSVVLVLALVGAVYAGHSHGQKSPSS